MLALSGGGRRGGDFLLPFLLLFSLLLPLYGAFSPIFSCMIPLDKVAVCLTCGNEWEVRTAGVGKKRKCTVCGKYRVKMKCEVEEDGNEPGSTDPVDGAPANVPVAADAEDPGMGHEAPDGVDEKRGRKGEYSPTSPENSPRSPMNSPEEKSGEKEEENSGGGIITYAALLLLAVGAGWFLVQSRHRAAVRRQQWLEEAEEERHNQRIPAFPGL